MEVTFPKPFCSLEPTEDKPHISRFIVELNVGRPSLEISTADRGKDEAIESITIRRSASCGSTW